MATVEPGMATGVGVASGAEKLARRLALLDALAGLARVTAESQDSAAALDGFSAAVRCVADRACACLPGAGDFAAAWITRARSLLEATTGRRPPRTAPAVEIAVGFVLARSMLTRWM